MSFPACLFLCACGETCDYIVYLFIVVERIVTKEDKLRHFSHLYPCVYAPLEKALRPLQDLYRLVSLFTATKDTDVDLAVA